MRLLLSTLALAVLAGYLAGGRLGAVARLHVRLAPLAAGGLVLQLAPVPGKTIPLILLLVSFVALLAFAVVNVKARAIGFPLILIGIVLNFAVIAVNRGMPVTEQALVASHQQDTLAQLVDDGGAKHHLAGPDDHLLFLGDVIAIAPIEQAVSPGDLFVYAGVVWLVVAAMLGRATPPSDGPSVPEQVSHVA